MLKLENIKKNSLVCGIEPDQIVRIVTTEPVDNNALRGVGRNVEIVGRQKKKRLRKGRRRAGDAISGGVSDSNLDLSPHSMPTPAFQENCDVQRGIAYIDGFNLYFGLKRSVRQRFPRKRVVVVFPPDRHSTQHQRCASGHLTIGEDKLRKSLLPEQIATARGHVLQRPARWQ